MSAVQFLIADDHELFRRTARSFIESQRNWQVCGVLLTSRFAMWMSWGPELTFLYNDDYAWMTLGKKHPWALGKPSREVWKEIWDDIGPRSS
jgi:hypothetical protein